jgi:hypothetical protein
MRISECGFEEDKDSTVLIFLPIRNAKSEIYNPHAPLEGV